MGAGLSMTATKAMIRQKFPSVHQMSVAELQQLQQNKEPLILLDVSVRHGWFLVTCELVTMYCVVCVSAATPPSPASLMMGFLLWFCPSLRVGCALCTTSAIG